VYLFGSRTDDAARGGDIDLWVRSDRIGYTDQLRLQVRLKERMGWQKIDLLVSARDDDPMVRVAAESAVRL
jgi:DNA polymerase sigma